VDAGFMPQSGRMALWQAPAELRVEHAMVSGVEVPPYYDSMIAKLVAHGRSRDEARRKLQRGLQELLALGITTNQVFLGRCLGHPVFAAGGATTAFIASHQAELLATDEATLADAAAVAALVLAETAHDGSRRHAERRLTHTLPLGQRFTLAGQTHAAALTQLGPHEFSADIAGQRRELAVLENTPHRLRITLDGVTESVSVHRDGPRLLMQFRGRPYDVADLTRAVAQRGGASGGDGKVRASMNGRVVAVLVAEGDSVQAGQPLLTLEAMKMEHVHVAPVAGRITLLAVGLGEQVAAQRVVIEVTAEAAAA
jgi:geranyl-CoA carboxylase alpha subunit